MKKILSILCAFLPMIFGACTEQTEKDADLITSYINENNLVTQETEDGIFYVITKEGTGANPTIDDKVTVNYRGTLLNGDEFDANNNITFPLRNVIVGWQKGIPLLREGGSGILIIPSRLGYGSQKVGSIKKNSVLVFEVDLLDIE